MVPSRKVKKGSAWLVFLSKALFPRSRDCYFIGQAFVVCGYLLPCGSDAFVHILVTWSVDVTQVKAMAVFDYRGAYKSLARPGKKETTATEDFEFLISYL